MKRTSLDPFSQNSGFEVEKSFENNKHSFQSVGGFNPSKYSVGGGKYTFGRETKINE